MSFWEKAKETWDEDYNVSYTENGAMGYKTTNKPLLDMNFSVSSMRNMTESEIYEMFKPVFLEDPVIAMKWLFYLRDIRGGLGERRSFRAIIRGLASNNDYDNEVKYAQAVFRYIPEYGRYDDLLVLLDTPLKNDVLDFIEETLNKDIENMHKGKNVTLLAKWLPRPGNSPRQKQHADIIRKYLRMTEKEYKKTLTSLRRYIGVVEQKMCAGQWGEIEYDKVPARASMIYRKAFMRHDEDRYTSYLESVKKGEAVIHAKTLFPHDIVSAYRINEWVPLGLKSYNETLELQWKNLPDFVKGDGKTLVVADGSWSMTVSIYKHVTALDVANALAIYFAERASGEFKDKYITFSESPQLVDLGKAKTLRDKILIALKHNEIANTNVEAVFDLILNTAIKHNMKQEDVPQNILIISDMEFDEATCCAPPDERLFTTIGKKYANSGYKLPRLVFWNVNSRTRTIPVTQNENGVALVSGFSPSVVNMVLSNEIDPYKCLVNELNKERYKPIEDAIKSL